MELNPSSIGQLVELKCQAWWIEHGWNVAIPIGNYQKYDMIVEKDGKCYRIQCKHAAGSETGFTVNTKYDKRVNGKVIKETYSKQDIDYFMTEYKNKYYLFPPFGTIVSKFWIVPPRCKTSRIAQDFNAEDILKTL